MYIYDNNGLGDLGRWGGFRKVFHAVQKVNPLHKIEQKVFKQVVRDTKRVVKAIKQDSRPDRLRKNLKYVAAAAAIYFGGPYAMTLVKTYGASAVKAYMAMRQMRARAGQPQPADANADFQNFIRSGGADSAAAPQPQQYAPEPQQNYVQQQDQTPAPESKPKSSILPWVLGGVSLLGLLRS